MNMRNYPRGRLNGVTADVGTILGPNDTGELMVVLAVDDGGVTVGYAQQGDVEAAAAAAEPRSLTEIALHGTGSTT